ncbi:hypothetical protein ACQJBY_062188 [Aegilops geniculata]
MASTLKVAVVVAALCALLVLTTGQQTEPCTSKCKRADDNCKSRCESRGLPDCARMCEITGWSCWVNCSYGTGGLPE